MRAMACRCLRLVGLLKQVCFWQMQILQILLKKSFLADEPNFSMRSTRGDVQSTAACRWQVRF